MSAPVLSATQRRAGNALCGTSAATPSHSVRPTDHSHACRELALEWLEGQRAAMYDPARADFFLQYLPGNPSNVTPGTIANDHRSQGDQYFFNFTVLDAQTFYITETLASLAHPAVDGTFTDDIDGLPAEHAGVPAALGMSAAALAALRFTTQQMGSALIYALVAAGKYTWQAFYSQDTSLPAPTPAVPLPPGRKPLSPSRAAAFRGPVTPSSCATYMRTFCALGYQGRPLLQHHDVSSAVMRNASVASFLITRPPIAYLGYSFASNDTDWDPLFALQVGEPTGLCAESPAGVFTRPYTLGVASLDCNSFSPRLPFDSLPLA